MEYLESFVDWAVTIWQDVSEHAADVAPTEWGLVALAFVSFFLLLSCIKAKIRNNELEDKVVRLKGSMFHTDYLVDKFTQDRNGYQTLQAPDPNLELVKETLNSVVILFDKAMHNVRETLRVTGTASSNAVNEQVCNVLDRVNTDQTKVLETVYSNI